jgi:hypothetical protein
MCGIVTNVVMNLQYKMKMGKRIHLSFIHILYYKKIMMMVM